VIKAKSKFYAESTFGLIKPDNDCFEIFMLLITLYGALGVVCKQSQAIRSKIQLFEDYNQQQFNLPIDIPWQRRVSEARNCWQTMQNSGK